MASCFPGLPRKLNIVHEGWILILISFFLIRKNLLEKLQEPLQAILETFKQELKIL